MNDQINSADVANVTPVVRAASPGRIVHYFPNNGDKHCEANGAEVVPAMVVQAFVGTILNLSVFAMNQDGPNVLRYSVRHRSEVNNEGIPYWDWPEIR